MFKEIKNRLIRIANPEPCEKCKDLGVVCKPCTMFNDVPGQPGDFVIYLNEDPVMRTREKISKCPVVTGTNTGEEVVAMIKKNAAILKNRMSLDDMKVSNW